MTMLQTAATLIALAGAFGAINHLVLKLPQSIGIMLVALLASLALLAVDAVLPSFGFDDLVREAVAEIEFTRALLDGMLGLLLFAGALHVNIGQLRQQAWAVALMATLGVAISTLVVGLGFAWITGMPLIVALLFGALISPTDPVAVLGVLRGASLRRALETKIAGESLFNDGVGYVVFLILLGLAFPGPDHPAPGLEGAVLLFVQEALGGAALGFVLGWLTFRVMRQIDDYALEVLLTLGLAFGGYELAVALHVSGPIFAVVAGLLIGDVGVRHGMSETTRRYVDGFWRMVDEVLNAVLFLLIGIEIFAVSFTPGTLTAGALAIGLALVARLAAVAVPVLLLRPFHDFPRDVIPIMTWGGLKGGISVALALSLPESEWRPVILAATYMVVVFSILVQGLTIAPLARRLGREPGMM
jgi:CPA1 family monovalent cation:H+ antiporter